MFILIFYIYIIIVIYCFFFFFSSRRRHTRSKRDWSSDVCSSDLATMARDESGGAISAVTDTEILAAQIRLAGSEGLFAEPASAAPLALLFRLVRDGKIDKDAVTVVVLTGSGLKDPDAALKNVEPPIELDGDARTLAKVLKL